MTRNQFERGAVSTIVAVLLAGGVLLGLLAISVDVGRTVLERRELQNGADAGALALAQSCAGDNCLPGADGLEGLVNNNAADGRHTITLQCGTPDSLPECPTGDISDLKQCPPLPSTLAGVKYVEVHTRTSSGAGSTIANIFGGAAGGDATSTVDACARAGWGAPKSASTIPIAFSMCEYLDAMNQAVPYGTEIALATKYSNTGNPCPYDGHTGMDAPGGFGWLLDSDCRVDVDAGGWVPGNTGESGVDCLQVDKVALLPLFDCLSNAKVLCDNTANGSNTHYHIKGFVAFHVTGWRNIPSVPNAGTPGAAALTECGDEAQNGQRCLFGYFVDDYVDLTGTIDPSAPDYGVSVVQPLG